MNRLLKVLLAPLLILVLISTTIYVGLLRGGAVDNVVVNVTENEVIRADLARAFVDVIIEGDSGLIGALIRKNREQVDQVVAQTFAKPAQREQLGQAAQQWVDAMLNGDAVVTLDPKPLYRPIYAAIEELLPILNFSEADLDALEPVVLGADEPLPDLRVLRTAALGGMSLFALWLLLALALYRRTKARALRTLGLQAGTIGLFGLIIVVTLPRVLAMLAGDATAQALTRTLLVEIASVGVWLMLAVTISGVLGVVLSRPRERTVAGEGAPDAQ